MQTANTAYDGESAKTAKSPDWLLVIAGWPTVYGVVKTSYSLTGDLVNFDRIDALASSPSGINSEVKGWPEGGRQTIGRWTVTINDSQSKTQKGNPSTGAALKKVRRSLSDLSSRQAYVLGTLSPAPFTTTLAKDLNATDTTVYADPTNFDTSGLIWIGQECIKYASVTGTTSFDGCTRGYLLTKATPHTGPVGGNTVLSIPTTVRRIKASAGTKIYSFMPNLYRRLVYLYRGYQGLANTTNFLPSLGGVIVGDAKDGPVLTLAIAPLNWELKGGDGERTLFPSFGPQPGYLPAPIYTDMAGNFFGVATTFGGYQISDGDQLTTGVFTNRWALRIDDEWIGVKKARKAAQGFYVDDYVRGLNRSTAQEHNFNAAVTPAWTNTSFDTATTPGSEPIDLLRQLLTSVNGDAVNGTYDAFEPGMGLGIPSNLLNGTSFSNVRAQLDWDTNARLSFALSESERAKDFVETEVCKPFGLYLSVGNDGRLNLIRPKHPQKFYVGGPNRLLSFAVSGTTYQAQLEVGVYSAQEIATELARAMNQVAGSPGDFSCTYSTATNKFTISKTSGTFSLNAAADNLAAYVGWDSGLPTGAASSQVAPTATGKFTTGIVMTQGDVWDVQEVDSRDLQISQVIYEYDYDWDQSKYRTQAAYVDAETVNLGDILGARNYVIKSRGLCSFGTSARSPWHWLTPPGGGCTPVRSSPNAASGADADTWVALTAYALLDRYKVPPLKLKCKARWGAGTDVATGVTVGTRMEVGDVVKFSYNISGHLVDRELDDVVLTNRLFEIVGKTDNHKDRCIELTLLGHRYVNY